MLNISLIFSALFLTLLFNYFFLKKKFLLDLPKIEKHKKLTSQKNIPISLGFVLVILNAYLLVEHNNFTGLLVFFIFLIGLSSDTRFMFSPQIRLIFQSLVIFVYLFLSQNLISDTRIYIIDILLNNYLFSIFFTLFCLTILINGTNFIDGINTLVIGYYIVVLSCIVFIINKMGLQLDHYIFELMSILVVLFVFNALGKSFLGDSGSYSIGFIIGIFLITISSDINNYYLISPWMIILLLWYPAFENLFSIIRRQSYSFSLSKADNLHLHHLFFIFIKRKTRLNYLSANILTASSINIYNALILFCGSLYSNNTQTLVMLIAFNIFIYVYFYLYLINFCKQYKNNEN